MKIYDKTNYIYTRYGNYRTISRNKILHGISSISDPNSYYIVLEQSILQNRPFKVISYLLTSYSSIIPHSLCATPMTTLIRQEIITNNKYRPKEKERIRRSVKYHIYGINFKNINCSKSDIQILYRVMNHFLHKNKINSI